MPPIRRVPGPGPRAKSPVLGNHRRSPGNAPENGTMFPERQQVDLVVGLVRHAAVPVDEKHGVRSFSRWPRRFPDAPVTRGVAVERTNRHQRPGIPRVRRMREQDVREGRLGPYREIRGASLRPGEALQGQPEIPAKDLLPGAFPRFRAIPSPGSRCCPARPGSSPLHRASAALSRRSIPPR